MINEKDLAILSYRGAPKIVSKGFPGAKTQEYLDMAFDNKSMPGLADGCLLSWQKEKGLP